MTNAFSTRRQNKNKTKDLRRSIQHVLDEMADLREDSESRYNEYIYQLKKILPIKEEFSLPAGVIAACPMIKMNSALFVPVCAASLRPRNRIIIRMVSPLCPL